MSDAATSTRQNANLLVDVGPVVLFIIVYNVARRFAESDAIFIGTGVFIVATLAALAYAWRVQKRLPPMLLISAVIVTVFGGIAIYLRDPIYAYIKPTIINLLYSYAILICYAFGVNVWKMLFGSIYSLPDRIWMIFAIRWAVFFQILAVLNEFLWRHINDTIVPESARIFSELAWSEAFWANMKLVNIPITFVFMLLQLPLLYKHQLKQDDAEEGEAPAE